MKEQMEEYGTMPTQEEYESHVRRLCMRTTDFIMYNIGSYGEALYYPYEIDSDGAPVDGAPYAVFETYDEAVECVKRLGGVLVDDYVEMCKKLKLHGYAEDVE